MSDLHNKSEHLNYCLPIVILGGGGHAKVLIDALLLCGATINGVLDPRNAKGSVVLADVRVIGDDTQLDSYDPKAILVVNGLGSLPGQTKRHELYQQLAERNYRFANVIHPTAIISNFAKLAEGVQVMAGSVIQAGTEIGSNTIINTRASIDHDCVIGKNVHIAPGAVLSGDVVVEDGVHIGTGASVIQGIRIGAGAVIGAGATVSKDVAAGETVYPFRAIEKAKLN